MEHLSFYWLARNPSRVLEGLETEFTQRVQKTIATQTIKLPPIPDTVLTLQRICMDESTTVSDIANVLLDDPSLAAAVIRSANTVYFNRRNITCTNLVTAVSRLGIVRVKDIVTAHAIEQLKHENPLDNTCQKVLKQSAFSARELGASMVLVIQELQIIDHEEYRHLEADKALLLGCLADIGLYCLVSEYHHHNEQGHYLDLEIALHIFQSQCASISLEVLSRWGFDSDFLAVSSNSRIAGESDRVEYLDVARIAHHLLMFRHQDARIDEHEVEINVHGAEVLYTLSNLTKHTYKKRENEIIKTCGW
ncbi:HDOD domain-containing protein [Vibrio splendidus]